MAFAVDEVHCIKFWRVFLLNIVLLIEVIVRCHTLMIHHVMTYIGY